MRILFDNCPTHLTCKISYSQISDPANPFKKSNKYNIKSQNLSIEHLDNNNPHNLYDLTHFV